MSYDYEAVKKAYRMSKAALARDLEGRVFGAVPLVRWSHDELVNAWLEQFAAKKVTA